ncbi:hypothetical protein RHSIM_RhsimUnG0034200 [Rhododendron simsii]|uniref:Uncharacterized protein n=1 Tax=Rhododendron simsii TaxID=118357 RepID=A0A834FXI4_RHOSS|nr:hypothetical protein RHSIM_RhsimUnG0034200 [Rhododendron simsii]
MPNGRVLLLNDSVKEEPNLAVTLLKGLALPRDYDQVPTDLLPGLGEMCFHLVQAGQAALKAYDKASKVSAECKRYRSDRDSYRTKWRISEQQVKEAGSEVEKLKAELTDAKAAAATTKAEVKKVKEEEREKLKVADAKGFFKLGYAAGANAMAGVMAIQPKSGFLKQLPELIIPDLKSYIPRKNASHSHRKRMRMK